MNILEFFRAAFTPNGLSQSAFRNAPRADTHWVSPEITIYRRQRSVVWQCRFKLRDGRWHRLSTGCADPDQAFDGYGGQRVGVDPAKERIIIVSSWREDYMPEVYDLFTNLQKM